MSGSEGHFRQIVEKGANIFLLIANERVTGRWLSARPHAAATVCTAGRGRVPPESDTPIPGLPAPRHPNVRRKLRGRSVEWSSGRRADRRSGNLPRERRLRREPVRPDCFAVERRFGPEGALVGSRREDVLEED